GLQLIATNAAAAADHIFKLPVAESTMPTLTPKELEVMRWTLHGKTAWEVGVIMSLSENTVRFHTTNVTRKLGVSSKH
ncbi:helix-turn-helix transcriptional regulator, partial [Acinetobacter baumannii]